MNKSKLFPIKSGKNLRLSFSEMKTLKKMPNLMAIQKDSFQWFLKDGLMEVFRDCFPVKNPANTHKLDVVGLSVGVPKNEIPECIEKNLSFAAPITVKYRLEKIETGELIEHDSYLCDVPLMTETGSFIINGAERVVVSQAVRSPGIYFGFERDKKTGKKLYKTTLIPYRGAWLEFEFESTDYISARVDRTRKVPISVFLRSLGLSSDKDIYDTFGDEDLLINSIEKEDIEERNHEAAILELYKKIKPSDQYSVETCESQLKNTLFNVKRYDLGKAGRHKFNKKLHLKFRVENKTLADDVVNLDTGELIAKANTVITKELATEIQNNGVPYIYIKLEDAEGNPTKQKQKILTNRMVDIRYYLPNISEEKLEELDVFELVYYDKLKEIMSSHKKEKDIIDAIAKNINELIPKHVLVEDIYASVNYSCHLNKGIGQEDNIDHLGNRRVRAVGELLQNQIRASLQKSEKYIIEKLSSEDIGKIIPTKSIGNTIREFFSTSQLSQFMDQNNPLSELTHKRRISSLGPNGISRDRAGFEVRDVHYTHYGRVCPIETPEGPNIGLINSLASYARINKFGFIEAPYRKVDKTNKKNPVVTDEIVYMTADVEDNYRIAQASEPLDSEGHFINENVSGRYRDEIAAYRKQDIDFMDISPRMVFSIATSMIPFLQNDDANRALMGSNMQRQAVPLMITESSAVGTGVEGVTAVDSGVCVIAKEDGEVTYVDADTIKIRDKNGDITTYNLTKFKRSNQSNSYNQKAIVDVGQKVEKGEVIADGPSTSKGEIALGKNPLIGFMTWEGYNYEDAVLLSERLVKDDVYTSIHIESYETEARTTKQGKEEITKDIPGVGDEARKDLDEDGVIRIGAEVRTGDILVGKVTPKGDQEMTAEEKLLHAIFKEKDKEVRDTSLKVPHGAYGVVIYTSTVEKPESDESGNNGLAAGVLKKVRVYVAQKRKISVGDKMAGRHGNKGVVSRVLPVEDMPYLPNGRPLDIVLNPLGVPSRMNIGQVLEIHLSLVSRMLGIDLSTPTFEGANENDIQDSLVLANDYVNIEWDEFKEKYKDILRQDVLDILGDEEHLKHREEWKGVNIGRDGKVLLRDGRTGEYFDSPTTIGFMNYLKLHHLVDDKIHARSTGPYSLITQQPLGGKAQFGGQRFGEMEVWALEAYGAAYTLQEILTVKSDDTIGRLRAYETIIKGENMPKPTIPESFKVLLKELQALCLDITIIDKEGKEVPITENLYDPKEEMKKVLDSDRKVVNSDQEFLDNGFQLKKSLEDLVAADENNLSSASDNEFEDNYNGGEE